MKNILLSMIVLLVIASCKKQMPSDALFEGHDDISGKGGKNKIDICHFNIVNGTWQIKNINLNAWPSHKAHGDVRLDDQDDDGFVPNNACLFGQMGDCNDTVAIIFPGAVEICNNGIDDDCDGNTDDADNDCIATAIICNQIWMVNNLDVSTYRNGDPIPQSTDGWIGITTGAWCWYKNDSATYAATYGKLYNWYAVNDPRGLAPAGWHIPTDVEWTTMTDCLGGESVAGGKMKETGTIEDGTGLWLAPNIGATNSSGFTGRPTGYRWQGDSFNFMGAQVGWWSSTEYSESNAWIRFLYFNFGNVFRYNALKDMGFPVRCVKD